MDVFPPTKLNPFPLPILELYAGIGGFSTALRGADPQVRLAIDIDSKALEVYEANHPHCVRAAEIATVDLSDFKECLWWMSPPCLPFTRRGYQRDHLDPRCQSLLSVIGTIGRLRPSAVAFENVPPFAFSRTWELFEKTLGDTGYVVDCRLVCPTQLGVPMRRKRFYGLAVRDDLSTSPPLRLLREKFMVSLPSVPMRPLVEYLEDEAPRYLSAEIAERFRAALNLIDPNDPQAIASCFASSYGKSIVRAGSYLCRAKGPPRFFSPTEIARLLGFPGTFVLPSDDRVSFRLLGNSLSLDVVRALYCPA